MYPQHGIPLSEETRFDPRGPKGKVRAETANMLLDAMSSGKIAATICRAPEFYGPDKTKSFTNALVFDSIKKRKRPKVLLRADTLRTLIWTPDASRAMALIGNTADAYHQTWHLPCDDNRLTYKQMIQYASTICGREIRYKVLNKSSLLLASLFNKQVSELLELLPRYEHDNIFLSDKFKKTFPRFEVTGYKKGIEVLLKNNLHPGWMASHLPAVQSCCLLRDFYNNYWRMMKTCRQSGGLPIFLHSHDGGPNWQSIFYHNLPNP
jgi:hypothetical protein